MKNSIEGDCRLTVVEICQELGISYWSVQSIIKNELQFRKISARWLPRLLSDQQKSPNRRKIGPVVLDCPTTAAVQPAPLPLRLPHVWTPQGGARGAPFRRWWAGPEFRAQLATDASSFILRAGLKKLTILWQKCIEKGGNYVDKREFLFCKIVF